ncbi:Cof-type HAD-IIB family hydrolase [Symbiobacterium thermophilum]|uniref:Haloacid dehalogenase-like hydrolase n=2 Tax=Symbiobacterium thermophilum TaxID=2734 RepID=Q67PK5_SYMTH|nr:Cof-type HAD-IIB family hydrolase [Symbiobacterium thermophilum]MBY6275067.1 Cof-type HAD-IIB family hydrolase [Symbiobacterium thermophilum]BAD40388.1 haloacid dehalogenase-like hydrolase [Symbiobacterium thermophilum IAM 14863]
MQYDLVISDMDGTLLRDDKTISDRTKEAIRRFEAAGGRFSFATGRGVHASRRYFEDLGLRTPLVLLNGSLLYDPVADRELMVRPLDPAAIAAVWPRLEEAGLHILVHETRRAVVREITPTIDEHLRLDGITVDVQPDLSPATCGDIVKILSIGEPEQLDRAEAAILAANLPVKLVRSFRTYLEVLPPTGGKGTGLRALLAHLGIPRERCLAVGDYLNDLDLLAEAGLAVVVRNAHPGVRAVAQRETLSNEEDGVAAVLDALVEGREIGFPIGG